METSRIATPEEPEADRNVEYKTTVSLVVEGFSLDLDFKVEPALLALSFLAQGSVDPVTLQRAFEPLREEDVRIRDNNVTMLDRSEHASQLLSARQQLAPPGQSVQPRHLPG
jgi:hypothetical protein